MSSIGGTAKNNEKLSTAFPLPAGNTNALQEVGAQTDYAFNGNTGVSDIVPVTGDTATAVYTAFRDIVCAASPANPFNLGNVNQAPNSTVNLLNGLKVYQLTSTAGHVLQAEITTVGTGYSEATGVACTGGSGTGCTVDITSVNSGKVVGLKINNAGSGFTNNQTLTISGGGGNAQIRINTIVFYRTFLYTFESHTCTPGYSSSLARIQGQASSYNGGSKAIGDQDYDSFFVNSAKIFEEPLTVVLKPSSTAHRVFIGQARNPHSALAGLKDDDGGCFPGSFGILGEDGILYGALDIISNDTSNVLDVGSQIVMPAGIRGELSDIQGGLAFTHVLDEDNIVLFTNLRCATAASFTGDNVPLHLTAATSRTFDGLGYEGGNSDGTDQFASSITPNLNFLPIVSANYSSPQVIPTDVSLIEFFPREHDALLRMGNYHIDESKMGGDFHGEVVSGTRNATGSGYTDGVNVAFTTTGGHGTGFTGTVTISSGQIGTNFVVTNAGDGYITGDILGIVADGATNGKVTVTTQGNSTLPFFVLPAGERTKVPVNTANNCSWIVVSTGSNDILYWQYLVG